MSWNEEGHNQAAAPRQAAGFFLDCQGGHPATAVQAKLDKAKSGTMQVKVQFKFEQGPNQGKTIVWYGFLTDATFDRTCETLRDCGWVGTDLNDFNSLAKAKRAVKLVLDVDNYNGNEQVKVKWVNPVGADMQSYIAPEEAKGFAERMRDRVARADGVNSAKKASPGGRGSHQAQSDAGNKNAGTRDEFDTNTNGQANKNDLPADGDIPF